MSGVPNSLTKLEVTYGGKNSQTCNQSIWVHNYSSGAWVKFTTVSVGTTERLIVVPVTGTLANYVSGSSGDGSVAVRVRCARDSGSFFTSADLLKVTFTR
jgi:hypothetical protein